uniref:Solute-binding protein family 3/N-terminal domain-containing protein n=1 Tax=Chromera velia CCMP2878 TaxID=1169474 RepID=A0A0G4HIB4_9ALVE|eukprot:Cvel_27841.t1-p1 / transcript=Cvel_27841.t1 / gene=Cvel_27841 / organism=Chromera_velia_CCMP2878 / gene_product=hypothetical protein / transcript_product=hypothetical protein / location=Cvel_scaffold3541:1519-10665(-) / protein_length=592 / sequence_SO=supercontig / SO=protein_coding / is_pseudo=false
MRSLLLASALVLQLCLQGHGTSTAPEASCAVRDAVAADSSLSFTDAIKGRTVRLGMESYFPRFVNLADNTGWTLDVVREMARRGKFSYTITDLGVPAEGQTWDEFVQTHIDSDEYDLIGSYYTMTSPRQSSGWAYTIGYLEVSDMLLAQTPEERPKDLFGNMRLFIDPFDPLVWVVLLVISVCAGLIHWYTDADRREENRETWKQFVLRKLNLRKKKYHYLMTLIKRAHKDQDREDEEEGGWGGDERRDSDRDPATKSRKSVTIVGSEKEQAEQDLEAVAQKIGWEEEAAIDYMDPLGRPEANIPRFPRIGASIYMKVGGLEQYTEELYANREEMLQLGYIAANEHCDMRIVGQPVSRKIGGFAQRARNDCQSALRKAVNAILAEMDEDGFLQVSEEFSSAEPLSLDQFSGIFVAYGFIAFVVVIFAFIRARTRKQTDFVLRRAQQDVTKRLERLPSQLQKRKSQLFGQTPFGGNQIQENPADEIENLFGIEREHEDAEGHEQEMQEDEENEEEEEEEEESVEGDGTEEKEGEPHQGSVCASSGGEAAAAAGGGGHSGTGSEERRRPCNEEEDREQEPIPIEVEDTRNLIDR